MKILSHIMVECMQELDAIGIEYGEIVEISVNARAKKRWGQCKKVSSRGQYSIEISACLLRDNVDIIATKNTVIHEILHTCEGCMNHGKNWKRQAEKVNRAYPQYNIKRCTSAEEKGIIREYPVKYQFHCADCGGIVQRMKKSNFTENYQLYRCGKCGGDFIKDF